MDSLLMTIRCWSALMVLALGAFCCRPSAADDADVKDQEKSKAVEAAEEDSPKPANIEDSVVKINVTARSPDFFRPWTKASPAKASGSGVVIAGPRILTNA